ncbi:MAG: 3-isopropylmalate dehydrogenase [Chloroflexi bacterium HGW-Chloroflexi-9]|nr:MAG: 3-isopropylmalate dehydrogenase [Chloroflexi bacterium HGW-Chloroflexi-9]
MATFNIFVLPGDGIGPEVTAEGVRVLEAIGQRFEHVFKFEQDLVGGASIDAHGVAILPEVLEKAKASDAVLFGAVGGPKWDNPNADVRPEQGLLALRSGLQLWANLRPVVAIPALINASTLKPEVIEGVDLVVIRELTSGLYFGKPQERRVVNGRREAVDTNYYNEDEIARVAHLGFRMARERRKKLTSLDKANVMASSRLWREVVTEVSKEYPDVALEHVLADAMTMYLIRRPRDFDVIIADNMFGDIITDEASMLTGSMGMLPSASIGTLREDGTGLGMYEPIHGSAPDIAGKGLANPLAMILTTAMLLRHSCGLEEEARAVEQAVTDVIEAGDRTADLVAPGAPHLSTREMAERVLSRLGA